MSRWAVVYPNGPQWPQSMKVRSKHPPTGDAMSGGLPSVVVNFPEDAVWSYPEDAVRDRIGKQRTKAHGHP